MYNACCFSGHRIISQYRIEPMLKKLKLEIEILINQGVTTFISGGALGFDTVSASMILVLKNYYPHIKLIFALPCKEQSRFWNKKEVDFYNNMLKEADEIIYTSEHYFNGCMHVRNKFMVNNSDYCICYLTKNTGGTAYTVDYAKSKGLKIININ